MHKATLRRVKRSARSLGVFSVACLALLPLQTRGDANYSVLVKFTSNYVYRGYSKSSGNPVVQGNLDYEHSSGFFIGTWVSQVDFDLGADHERANIEVTPYAGWSLSLSEDWRADLTLAAYIYDHRVFSREADYGELFGQVHFRDLVTARIGVSIDAYGSSKSIQDYELHTRFPLTDTTDVSGVVGYEDSGALLTYDSLYWNIGATWFLHKYAALDLRYYDTERLGAGKMAPLGIGPPGIENHVVVSVSLGF
ncbi:MAG: TorF family putative porin [Gammaproteobacteria bacterium]